MTDMLKEALKYVRNGWYVFPCREKPGAPFIRNGQKIIPGEKTPYTAHGLDDATIDEKQIISWWSVFPNAMIGVNAGKSGLFVVDIDKKMVNGLDTFSSWNINDSAGLHSTTPSGGMHIVFSGEGKSSTNANTGIDTRGKGGYFIAPPSRVYTGDYPGEYKCFDDWNRSPGVIPDGLMEKLFESNPSDYVSGLNSGAKEGELKQLSRATLLFLVDGAPAGERNVTLFKVLADFAGCGYTAEQARSTAKPVAQRIGLPDDEFEKVLEHAYSKPRTASIPDTIQQKIMEEGKNVASKITFEEQSVMEDVLIGCMLTENSVIPAVADFLGFDDFLVVKNRLIYKIILQIYDNELRVDYLTVGTEVQKQSNNISLEDVRKLLDTYELIPENAVTYAKIIKEKGAIRRLEAILDNKKRYLQQGNLTEIVSNLEKDIGNIALEGGVKSTNILTAQQATVTLVDFTKKIMSGEITQLKTGFTLYDNIIGGFFPDELILCAGRSGDGKSALVLSMANHIVTKEKKGVLFFSLEMSTRETIARFVSQLTGLNFRKIYRGQLNNKEWEEYRRAMDTISKTPLFLDDSFGLTISEIRSKIRKLKDTQDISLIIIDQLEQLRGYDNLPEFQKLNKLAYDLSTIPKEFGTTVLLNHQLNRNMLDRKLKNPEPEIGDLNQAGEKPAYQVWAIAHRKDEHNQILQSKIKVLKNRNGERIEFPVVFLGERLLFTNPTKQNEREVFHSKDEHFADTDDDDDSPFWAED